MPISQYRPVHDYIRSLDPGRLTGDIYVLARSTSVREAIYQIGGVLLPEISVDQSGNADHPFTRWLGELLLQEPVWQQGIRFIRGVSTTPIGEFIPMGVHRCGDHRPYPYPYVELERWYLAQVALNARAFEVLWGPSQTEGGCDPSQIPWGSWAKVMEIWTWQTTLVRHLTTTLRAIILSPSSFSRIAGATPPFEEPSYLNGWVYRGVYAAQKQAGGVTYLAVITLKVTTFRTSPSPSPAPPPSTSSPANASPSPAVSSAGPPSPPSRPASSGWNRSGSGRRDHRRVAPTSGCVRDRHSADEPGSASRRLRPPGPGCCPARPGTRPPLRGPGQRARCTSAHTGGAARDPEPRGARPPTAGGPCPLGIVASYTYTRTPRSYSTPSKPSWLRTSTK